jgi:hypothetical protein
MITSINNRVHSFLLYLAFMRVRNAEACPSFTIGGRVPILHPRAFEMRTLKNLHPRSSRLNYGSIDTESVPYMRFVS